MCSVAGVARAPLNSEGVLDGDDEDARHERSYDAGRYGEDPEHLRALRDRKRHAHDLCGRDRVRAVCPAAEDFFRTLAERGETLAPCRTPRSAARPVRLRRAG